MKQLVEIEKLLTPNQVFEYVNLMSHFAQHHDISVELNVGALDGFSVAIYTAISANSVHSKYGSGFMCVNRCIEKICQNEQLAVCV